jgi:diadenosine tetraphosphate (Ap4A) HIT family hydrolase
VPLWDSFPASPGHALVVPRRHVAGWFAATRAEQRELLEAVDVARARIEASHAPDGYNIGVNVGAAVGQTVFHHLVRVIPRHDGRWRELGWNRTPNRSAPPYRHIVPRTLPGASRALGRIRPGMTICRQPGVDRSGGSSAPRSHDARAAHAPSTHAGRPDSPRPRVSPSATQTAPPPCPPLSAGRPGRGRVRRPPWRALSAGWPRRERVRRPPRRALSAGWPRRERVRRPPWRAHGPAAGRAVSR